MENGETHVLLSFPMPSLLRMAEADMPARGMDTMMKMRSLKVGYLRSKGVLKNQGLLSPKKKKKLEKSGWRPDDYTGENFQTGKE
jgi:hypothetical protein